MVTVAVAASGQSVKNGSAADERATLVGRLIAQAGCNLLTGGGLGAMKIVARAFCQTPGRVGRSIAMIPGFVDGLEGQELGSVRALQLEPKPDYPNPFVEIPIFTHLLGKDPKSGGSRNIINMVSADLVVALAGGKGTQAELELALALDKPVIAFLSHGDKIGNYAAASLPGTLSLAQDNDAFGQFLMEKLTALPRPSFTAARSVHKMDEA